MGSKPRRYPVGGIPLPEKREVTKNQILFALQAEKPVVKTLDDIRVACAHLHNDSIPLQGQRDAALKRSRQYIDFPQAERLLNRMVQDGLLTARAGGAWLTAGAGQLQSLQATSTYYATPDQTKAIDDAASMKRFRAEKKLAQEKAAAALIKEHQNRFDELAAHYLTHPEDTP